MKIKDLSAQFAADDCEVIADVWIGNSNWVCNWVGFYKTDLRCSVAENGAFTTFNFPADAEIEILEHGNEFAFDYKGQRCRISFFTRTKINIPQSEKIS